MGKFIKFIVAVLMLGGVVYWLSSFNQSPKDKEQEVYAYVMTINELNKKQQQLVNDYTVHVAEANNPAEGYAYLESTLIPAYVVYQEEVAMVKPLNEDLEAVYELYDNAVEQQLDIYREYNRAYKEQETVVYEKANALLEANNEQFAEHEEKMKALAKEYGILLKEG